MNIADLRREYTFAGLRRADLHSDPLQQFKNWFQAAISAEVPEPNAMTLATVDVNGQPSSRTVLLKDVTPRGFTFYTNYQSRKGRELAANPRAALTFFWAGLERQVCVRGICEKGPRPEAEAYFKSRPIGNRLGAWASDQSSPIPSREHLEEKLREVTSLHGENPPLPAHWGGYLLVPETVDFWQGRPSRLHDRFLYSRTADGWKIERLSP
jgi:pyridoxamine 5'-phosphate oxidase